MKEDLFIAIAALVVVVPGLYASQTQGSSKSYVRGTVVDVQDHEVESPASTVGGSNPSDASLTAKYSVYVVSVRVGCKTYVGQYATPFNYLPSAFTPDKQINVRLTKHVMYFNLPNSQDIKMRIVRRTSECSQDH